MKQKGEVNKAPRAKREAEAEVIDIGKTDALAPGAPANTPEITDDEQTVQQAGVAVIGFLAKAAAFFRRASEIETAAVETLERAKQLQKNPPKNGLEDAAVQKFILKTNEQKKEAEAHWTITTAVNSFHKRLTGARGRATGAIDQANAIANGLHKSYTQAEARRVEEENRRIEAEATKRQQAIVDQELAEMEARALKAEGESPKLSDREQMFVDLFSAGSTKGNVAECARRAGYKNAADAGPGLLARLKIQKALEAKRAADEIRRQAEAVKREPLPPVSIVLETPDVQKGGSDREYWSAEIFNEAALIADCIAGRAPQDMLCIDQAKANAHAKSQHEQINRWAGIRAVNKPRLV